MRTWALRCVFTGLGPLLVAVCFLGVSQDATIGTAAADDAYFYLTVARNAALGQWSSFDGTTLTNGFHPLWAALLVPLFSVVAEADTAWRVALLACCLLHALSLQILWRLLLRWVSLPAACFGTAFYVLFAMVPGWYLGEGPLAMAAFLCFVERLLAVARDDNGLARPARAGGALGLCAAAVALARLDAILPVAAGLGWLALTGHRERRIVAAVAWGVLAVVLGAYLTSNVLVHGHWLPISGALKSSFPQLSPINYPLASPKWYRLLVPLLVVLAFIGWTGWAARRANRGRAAIDRPLAALAAGFLAFYGYELLFQKDADYGLYSWHFAVATSFAALLAGRLFHAVVTSPRWRRSAGPTLLLVALVVVGNRYGRVPSVDATLADAYRIGRWIDEHLPERAVVATTDPGLVAYFGKRPTISLDGLINNFEFQVVLRDRQLVAYLEQRGVTHLVVRDRGAATEPAGEFLLALPARLHPGTGDALVVAMQDRLYSAPNGTAAVFLRRSGEAHSRR